MSFATRTFGLDFGTSKTAMVLAERRHIQNVTDITRQPTCLLEWGGAKYIGDIAEEEFTRRQLENKTDDVQYWTNFKPHIREISAQAIASDFFQGFFGVDEVRNKLDFTVSDEMGVLVAGCPVTWDHETQEMLLRLLPHQFTHVYCLPEPVDAAFHFLSQGFRSTELQRDILVVDWGAGTFDLTLMRSGEMKAETVWGSTIYGGRLFDDLVFQWLCSQILDSKDERRLEQFQQICDHPQYSDFVQTTFCKEIKEHFSTFIKNSRSDTPYQYRHPIAIGDINLGWFRSAAPNIEFKSYLRAYTPSKLARRWIEAEACPEERIFVDKMRQNEPIDLCKWAEVLIDAELKHLHVSDNTIAILTGGSSNWKWFQKLVSERPPFNQHRHLYIDDNKPEMTIARGLALAYPIGTLSLELKRRLEERRTEIQDALSAMIRRDHTDKLANVICTLLRSDDALANNISGIFECTLSKATLPGLVPENKDGFWGRFLKAGEDWYEAFREFVGTLRFDQKEIQPELSGALSTWMSTPNVLGEILAAADGFAQGVFADAMTILKEDTEKKIEDLMQVAIAVCNATGEQNVRDASVALIKGVRLGPTIWQSLEKFARDVLMVYVNLFKRKQNEPKSGDALRDTAQQLTSRFVHNYEAHLRLALHEEAANTAIRIIEHLVGALSAIIEMSGVLKVHPEEVS